MCVSVCVQRMLPEEVKKEARVKIDKWGAYIGRIEGVIWSCVKSRPLNCLTFEE